MRSMPTFLRFLCCLCCLSLFTVGSAADKTLEKAKKVLAGSDSAAKKAAVNSLASGGEDTDRIPALIAAMSDRQVGKFALEALERLTGLKPAVRSSGNPGYPGYPKTRDAGGWSGWWAAKQKEAADKAKMEELEEAQKKAAEEAAAKEEAEGKEEEAEEDEAATVTKKVKPDHEKYGKLDRVIFKNGNSLMCYILSKQVDLDGNLTSIDIVHRNGGGQESLNANMISSYEEDVR